MTSRMATPTPSVLTAADLSHVTPFVDGRFERSSSEERFATYDPSSGKQLVEISVGSSADADRAVASARASVRKGSWFKMPPSQKKSILHR